MLTECKHCGDPNPTETGRCAACEHDYTSRRRSIAALREQRLADGKCTRCGKANIARAKLCNDCWERKSAESKATWARHGHKYRETHKFWLKRNRNWKRNRNLDRWLKGLCKTCGSKLPDDKFKTCAKCRAIDRERRRG